jgi:hypothetical protein
LTKRKISASTVIPLIMSSSTTRFNYDGDATLAPIVIILQKNGQPDDKLVIRPTENSVNFAAVFTQNTIGVRTERQLAHSELFPYIERFLESLSYDEQSCDFVQIDVPGYTSVMLQSKDVQFYLDTFYAQVRSLHNSWPMEVEGTRIQPRATSPFAWSSYTVPAATQTQQTQVETTTRPKRSASPRVTRAAARRAAF